MVFVRTDVSEGSIASIFRVRSKDVPQGGRGIEPLASVLTSTTRRHHIPEDIILHCYRRENIESISAYQFVACQISITAGHSMLHC
jgi:hypothetical protein